VRSQKNAYGMCATDGRNVKMRVATVNVGTMVVEMLARRGVYVCCVQEVQYKGEGCRVIRDGVERYKFCLSGEKKDKRVVTKG